MKATATKVKDGTIQQFDVAIYHFLSQEQVVVLQLRNGLLSEVPEKTLYTLEIRQDDGTVVATYENVLFNNYNFTMDESAVGGKLPESPSIINNSLKYIVP